MVGPSRAGLFRAFALRTPAKLQMVTNEDAGSPHHAIGSGDALRFVPWHRPEWPAGDDTAEEGWEQAFAKPSCGEDKSAKGKWRMLSVIFGGLLHHRTTPYLQTKYTRHLHSRT